VQLILDVKYNCYVHELLTGRKFLTYSYYIFT
jgi:deoxyxylulose-5-phosphate synthase